MSVIAIVVPTVRPEQMAAFRDAWAPLIERHNAVLITVWDGDAPRMTMTHRVATKGEDLPVGSNLFPDDFYRHVGSLVCRHTRAVCNLGFLLAARMKNVEYILTLDDDVAPLPGTDPIQDHLDALNMRVSTSWMNTAMPGYTQRIQVGPGPLATRQSVPHHNHDELLYLRGVPYTVREESPVMVSHGVWVGVPDFDGQTQLALSAKGPLPYELPYYRGPVPAGVYLPFCGMSVMVRREVLPYFYFAPMGPDSGFPELSRFDDIWMGCLLKDVCDDMRWAMYTGASTILHTRASDPHKNVAAERLGIEWNEHVFGVDRGRRLWPRELCGYWDDYHERSERYAKVVTDMLG